MLSAMYENGGNATHRLLDGHPELFVYPFESQPGTKFVNDFLSSLYPLKYRWPVFPTDISAEDAYELIIDEEAKIRMKTPRVSKFQNADLKMTDIDRKKDFVALLRGKSLNRAHAMEAFFRASFNTWKNYPASGKEKVYVGYSPIIGVDGEKIINDFPHNGYILHIVRNPFSAYADTKKRPVPLSLAHYMTGWVTAQYFAKLWEEKYPGRFFVLRFEDIVKNPRRILARTLSKIGIRDSETLSYPSWNGERLAEVYPWGTVRIPTGAANLATAQELSKKEISLIYERTEMYIEYLGYTDLYRKLSR